MPPRPFSSGASAIPLARGLRARLPAEAPVLALLMGLLHLMPYARALWTLESGYELTGNLSSSPDYMQYRVWARRTALTGPITDNAFTTEPHEAYLPVVFYWAIGGIARALGCRPEWVYAAAGAVLAAVLTLLVLATARALLGTGSAARWTAWFVLLGGGLGAALRLVESSGVAGERASAWLAADLAEAPVWEAYRSNYPIKVLFDAHFLLVWVATIGALLVYLGAVRRPSPARWALVVASSAAVALVHVYEGPLLLLIFALMPVLCAWHGQPAGPAWRASAAGAAGVAVVLVLLWALLVRSGLPFPPWNAPRVTPLKLVLAYPVAWILIAGGLAAYWRRAGTTELFLLAWAGACVLITLAGPLYRYSGRGPTTLQLPLLLIAGGIYFARRDRVRPAHLALALALSAWSPLYELRARARMGGFDQNNAAAFLSAEARGMVDALRARAGPEDVLLADVESYRWLAPEHPGRSYHAHFFLTVGFERKREEVDRFYRDADAPGRARFLHDRGINFLHVREWRDPDSFRDVPGLRELARAHGGVLFAFEPPPASR